jgi:hypothetical protein
MPHQRAIADIVLEIDPGTGRLAYSEVVLIGPRQVTGKTELVLPAMAHRCVGFAHAGPQRVMYTAQTADDARTKWRDVHLPRLQRSRDLRRRFTARLTRNQEAFMWGNGSIWFPGSTTGKTAGTGDTLDMGIIDEAWSRPNARTELGMRPAMMTRPWRQLWILSMIPGISRALPGTWKYLEQKRQTGRARVESDTRRGMAYFEFAAPDGADPDDPATWWLAMPGLGRTVELATVAEDHDAMDAVDFAAEYLSIPPQAQRPRGWKVVEKERWEELCDPYSGIDGTKALAVEVSEDRTHAWIGVAGRRFDGHWHGEVIEPGYKIAPGVSGMGWVEPRLLELCESHKPCTVVIDPRRPANTLIVPLRNAGYDVTTPNQQIIGGACGRFYDATRDDALTLFWHLDQPELRDAVRGAKTYDLPGGGFTFVRAGEGDLGALYCVVLAMHGHAVKAGDVVPEPDIFLDS